MGSDGELGTPSFKASSEEEGFVPASGRLDGDKCWKAMASDESPEIQVALLEEFKIFGIRLQACPDGTCSISSFVLSYSEDNEHYIESETVGFKFHLVLFPPTPLFILFQFSFPLII